MTLIPVAQVSGGAFTAESECVQALVAYYASKRPDETQLLARAGDWTRAIRRSAGGFSAESMMQAYGLDTEEGAALMSLAEALLRIPDAATADRLIHDTLEGKHWERFTQGDEAWPVRLSGWGLLLGGGMAQRAGILPKLAARLGDSVLRAALRQAMRLIGRQFVLGETIGEGLHASGPFARKGYRFSYDMLGEGARSDAQAEAYTRSYLAAVTALSASRHAGATLWEAPGLSVKLSALHARYHLVKQERLERELLPRLAAIAQAARRADISLAIDAEESSRLDIEMLLYERLSHDPALAGWNGLGFVVQAYQKRAPLAIDWLASLARAQSRIIPVRLVKGAYWDSEIKAAQVAGLPDYPVFTRKAHTDLSYAVCAAKLLAQPDVFYPQFATHNARTLAEVIGLAEAAGVPNGGYEVQRLHGMGETLHDRALAIVPSRIYAPIGPHKDLLAYLIRRLLENGANTSFIHLLLDESQPADALLADPLEACRAAAGSGALPPPRALYGERLNSAGMDFGNLAQLKQLRETLVSGKDAPVASMDASQVAAAVSRARDAFVQWRQTPVEIRAARLEETADLLEAGRGAWLALIAQEAGRTLADGLSELREAADYCRYYAMQARRLCAPQTLPGPVGESNVLTLHPRGVFACISPWNFPLAIFLGQIAAALAAGNCVVAKPAEQTPRIARRAIAMLHAAGFPPEVVQLVMGERDVVGPALVAQPGIDGVAFTGSLATAQAINRTLAARERSIIPLIAETGGQNAMIVDSSALPEQAVDDIVQSAFGSAGQRCSALRVLYVQEEIADSLLDLLAGAMRELTIGDPLDPASDIGPVIDRPAQEKLSAYIADRKNSARWQAATPLPLNPGGYFVAPHAFEIGAIHEIPGEVFGPVLHVIRFPAGGLEAVCDAINAAGFGLTFGMHSRIGAQEGLAAARIRAGNLYINRGMTGAVVGVQPFGGEGLSGTGFKAGGPHTLLRFMTERTLTVNTAAIGGNAALLSGQESR